MRRCVAIFTLALLCALPLASAQADGDPASDVLLGQDLFLPYAPNTISAPVQAALKTTMARAKARGFPVKVAIIADPRDLGSAGQLFTQPQNYANLLTREISLNVVHGTSVAAPRVLIVLPGGLGGNNLGDNAGSALAGVLPGDAPVPDQLARTAAIAIGKLAAADGKPITLPTLPAAAAASKGGGGLPTWLLFAAPVLLMGLALFGVNARASRAEERSAAASEDPAPG
jgi:hypothetical protein